MSLKLEWLQKCKEKLCSIAQPGEGNRCHSALITLQDECLCLHIWCVNPLKLQGLIGWKSVIQFQIAFVAHFISWSACTEPHHKQNLIMSCRMLKLRLSCYWPLCTVYQYCSNSVLLMTETFGLPRSAAKSILLEPPQNLGDVYLRVYS